MVLELFDRGLLDKAVQCFLLRVGVHLVNPFELLLVHEFHLFADHLSDHTFDPMRVRPRILDLLFSNCVLKVVTKVVRLKLLYL